MEMWARCQGAPVCGAHLLSLLLTIGLTRISPPPMQTEVLGRYPRDFRDQSGTIMSHEAMFASVSAPVPVPCPLCSCTDHFSSLDEFSRALANLLAAAERLGGGGGLRCAACPQAFDNLSDLHRHIQGEHLQNAAKEEVGVIRQKGEANDTIDDIDQLLNDFSEYIKEDLGKAEITLKGGHDDERTTQETQMEFKMQQPQVQQVQIIQQQEHQEQQQAVSGAVHSSFKQEFGSNTSLHVISVNEASTAPRIHQPQQQVQCELCGWNFDDSNFLQLHQVLMHSNRRNRETTEEDGGGSQQQLRSHLQQLQPEEPQPKKEFRCPACRITIRSFEDYIGHLQESHNDQRSACRFCGKLFKLKGSLLVHQRVVHSPSASIFRCSVCNRKFNNKYRRDIHERRHGAASPSAREGDDRDKSGCITWNADFSHTRSLGVRVEQKLQNREDIMFRCKSCLEGFKTHTAMLLHSVCHLKEKQATFQHRCANCGRSYAREQQLLQHQAKVHGATSQSKESKDQTNVSSPFGPGGNNPGSASAAAPSSSSAKQWECETCHKTFTTKYFLKKHNRLHTGETPYKCQICGRSFTFQQSFHKHMLYHTDEKPYSCSQCGRAFKELSTLQNHERIHSGERPFECETCGKSFRQRVSYLVHRRIHTGVMPYSCQTCGKSFRYKVTQRTHKCTQQQQEQTTPTSASTSSPSDVRQISLPQNIQRDLAMMRNNKRAGNRLAAGATVQLPLQQPLPQQQQQQQQRSRAVQHQAAFPMVEQPKPLTMLLTQHRQQQQQQVPHQHNNSSTTPPLQVMEQMQQLKISHPSPAPGILLSSPLLPAATFTVDGKPTVNCDFENMFTGVI